MNVFRYGLLAACGAVLVRFLATPTPQCTVALLGTLAAVVLMEWTRHDYLAELTAEVNESKRRYKSDTAEYLEAVKSVTRESAETAKADCAALRKDLDETRAKVDNLSSRRAFGG